MFRFLNYLIITVARTKCFYVMYTNMCERTEFSISGVGTVAVVSSANKDTNEPSNQSTMSFIKIINNNGPSTLPWGTPMVTWLVLDL